MPLPTPVTSPVVETDAIAEELVVHVYWAVSTEKPFESAAATVNVTVSPIEIETEIGLTDTDATTCCTDTKAVPTTPPVSAIRVVVPLPTASATRTSVAGFTETGKATAESRTDHENMDPAIVLPCESSAIAWKEALSAIDVAKTESGVITTLATLPASAVALAVVVRPATPTTEIVMVCASATSPSVQTVDARPRLSVMTAFGATLPEAGAKATSAFRTIKPSEARTSATTGCGSGLPTIPV